MQYLDVIVLIFRDVMFRTRLNVTDLYTQFSMLSDIPKCRHLEYLSTPPPPPIHLQFFYVYIFLIEV